MNPDSSQFQRVEEIFDRIVRLPRPQWTGALDQACNGDADLRRELESLLQHVGPESAGIHVTDALREFVPEILPDPNIGRRIGPYEIQWRLGAGGMGNVYLATQLEPVRRNVALKLIRRGLDTEETIRRFCNERQVLAALNHASIARLLDGGTTDDGRPYFVMEYVEGEPLIAYCDRNRLGTHQRLRLFQAVCAAVHYAHQNTVIHRDLKPGHILVTADAMVKLLDFGIAKLTNRESNLQTLDLTRPEDRLMTPEYASPEQIRGEVITTATDIYSLGVILYELLTGCPPYRLSGRSKEEIERIILEGRELPRPSDMVRRLVEGHQDHKELTPTAEMIGHARGVSPEQLPKQLRGDIDDIILTAVRKEPGRRYASAEQFSADIERHLRHEPVLAAPPGAVYRLCKFARRNKAACALAVAICLGLIGSSLGALWAVKARQVARAAERVATERAERLRRAVYAKELTLAFVDGRGNIIESMKRRLRETPQDLRDWEWEYLNARADESLQTWLGHEAEVRAVAISPDGSRAASGDADGVIRLWDTKAGTTSLTLHGHQGVVNSVAFSSDGRQLASGGSDGTLCIWDPLTGGAVAKLDAHAGNVVSVRFKPGGGGIAAGYADQAVRVWDSGTVIRSLSGFGGRSDSLAFSPDGRFLSYAGTGNWFKVWNVETGAEVPVRAAPLAGVSATAFSADGRLFAAALLNGRAQVWDVAKWTRLRTDIRRVGLSSPSPLSFSPDGQRLASTGPQGRTLTLWGLPNGVVLRNFRGHDGLILAAAFSPDGRWVVTGGTDHTLKVWDGNPTQQVDRFREHRAAVSGLAFSPDGQTIISGDEDGVLLCWDADARGGARRLQTPAGHLRCLAFTSDGRSFLTGSTDGSIMVWSAATGMFVRILRAHQGVVTCLAGRPCSPAFVSGGADAQLKLWDPDSGKQLRTFSGHQAPIHSAAFSPDGRLMASGDANGAVRVWDAAGGSCVRALAGHRGTVRCVAFSPDGERFVSGGDDRAATIWDAATGGPLLTLEGLGAPVVSAYFSPSGRRIITASADGTIRILDAVTGVESLTFHSSDASATCLALSPDGRTLMFGSARGLVVFIPAVPYTVDAELAREGPARASQAEALLDELYTRTGDWEQVAAVIRADRGLPPLLRHRALWAILIRSTECIPPVSEWDMRFFEWKPPADVREMDASWRAAAAGRKIVQRRARTINFDWNTSLPAPGIPREHFGMLATATLRTAAGRYRLSAASDDGLRIWIDERKVLDTWPPHPLKQETTVELDLTEGDHAARAEYYQLTQGAYVRICLQAVGPGTAATAPAADEPQQDQLEPQD